MKTKQLLLAFFMLMSLGMYAVPYCIPTSTNGTIGGDFINGVNLGTIDNQNTGSITGTSYNDFSNLSTDISQGGTFSLTINGGTFAAGFYGAWIDYNGDSTFATTEKLGQVQTNGANQFVTITFTVPINANLGNTRLRVRSARNTNNMDPCQNYTRGETEDYSVNILVGGGNGPVAYFGAVQPSITLGNTVDFVDSTSFNPTSWQWTFAGGTPSTSSLQNPTGINYSAVGCYAVTLTATNANGSNTLTRTCYIIVNPANPYCNTLYTGNCSGTNNINAVNITNTTLNNAGTGCNSLSGTAYSIFPESGNTTATLYRGQSYQLNVTSASTNSSIAAWIDYNMNNLFDSTEYISVASPAVQNLASSVIVSIPPTNTIGNIRMRIRSRVAGFGPGGGSSVILSTDACTSFTSGEAEDYIVTIADAPPVAPTANFTADSLTITAGQNVDFTDLSAGLPTSWNWTFDGGIPSTSNLQNPQNIVFNTPGCYNVTLVATNAQGSNTLSQSCYITVLAPAYCSVLHQANCSANDFISAVAIPSTTLINDSTACDALNGNGYSIWPAVANRTGDLFQTGTYQINVTTNANRIIGMWIDYNHSTTFDSTEFTLVSANAAANVMASANFTIPASALFGSTMMRIRSRNVTGTITALDACTLFGSGETEDYTITIQPPPTIPPVAAFSANPITVAIGQSVNFTDLSTNLPTGWSWTFVGGSPSTSTLQNPQNIVYNTLGCYAVTLIATNAYGSNTLEIPCYINVVVPPYCSNIHTTNCSAADNINTVSIANTTINNANTGCNGAVNSNAYSVFPVSAFTSDTLLQGYTYQISVTTTANRIIACWIDYNQNGTFENSEYSSIATTSVANVASTANLTIPTNALLGNTRMRIRSRNVTGTITAADACTLFGSGETEDYTITIGAAPQIPPIAAFSADSVAITLGQNVDFSDISTNIPTTWSWSFPGGQPSTSNIQNPQNIVYSTAGCYPVTLIVSNAYGSDTTTINCFVNVTPPPYCSALQSNNCGGGPGGGGFINTVAIANTNFINANTGCSGNPYIIYPANSNTTATLNRGTNYNISVTTTTSQKVGIWIDFNHNYLFDASEFSLVANATPANIPATISVLIPSSAFVGQTGMRVRCVNTNTTLAAANACTSNANGETEDYTITIGAGGNNPPSVDFSADFTSISPFGSINFSDNSSNTPTDWLWSFPGGSPSTSTDQNPTGIIYGSPGCYDVKLVATNAFGSDSLTKPCYINVTTAATYCVPTHTNLCTNSFINTVQITGTSLNNSNSGCNNITSQGYSIWPATGNTTAQLNRNQSYNLKVTCNIGSRISVWIDYNHNNIFETTEWTQVSTGSQPNIASTVSIFVPSTAVAGPTGMRIRSITTPTGGPGGGVNGAANSCTTFASGESEDYTITIFDPTLIPVANFTNSSPTTICSGNTISFTDLSSNSPNVWHWDLPGSTVGFSNLQNPTVTYDSVGVFPVSLTASNGNGSGTFTINGFVTINAIPNLNAGPSSTICLGSSTQLLATGGTSYSWSPAIGLSNPSIANPIANPSSTTVYSVTTNSNGCSATDTLIITVNSAFANAGNDVSVCNGGTVNLAATGGGTYLWSPATGLSDATIANPIANPLSTTNYSVLVTNNGCTATDAVLVTINSVIANAGQDISICSGTPSTLNATGGDIFSWSPSLGLSNPSIQNPIANPSQTTTYQVMVSNSITGCSAMDSITVTVVGADVTAGLDITVCPANTAQLLASGGTSYSWSPAINLDNASIPDPIFTAGSSTTYIVTILEGTCVFIDTLNVTVGNVTADAGIDASICIGGNTQLIATGGASYLWTPSTGLSNPSIANPIASPSSTTTYTVVSSSGSCSATDQITITVVPAISANAGNDVSICLGSSTTLNSTGGTSYLWSPSLGLSNPAIANPSANPTSTTSYIVSVSNGICNATDTVIVSVQSLNVNASIAGISNSICLGDSLQLNASASGIANFFWNPAIGLSTPSNANTMASPALTTEYIITANDGICIATDTVTIVVNAATGANITVNGSTSICEGSTTSLICPVGAPITGYLWSNGDTNNQILVQTGGCYDVIVFDSNGCTAISTPTCIIVNPLPQTPVIILNNDGSLSASVLASSYIWNLNGVQLTETTQTIFPTINGIYTVSAVSDSGCSSGVSETFDYLITQTTSRKISENISIYPNPANSAFFVNAEFERPTQIKITMTDITGRIVMVIENGSLAKSFLKEINISDLTNGIYFINFSNDEKTITKKLLKE